MEKCLRSLSDETSHTLCVTCLELCNRLLDILCEAGSSDLGLEPILSASGSLRHRNVLVENRPVITEVYWMNECTKGNTEQLKWLMCQKENSSCDSPRESSTPSVPVSQEALLPTESLPPPSSFNLCHPHMANPSSGEPSLQLPAVFSKDGYPGFPQNN